MDGTFDAVLFDRDGTLIRDVPYNGDPSVVTPMPGAREVLRELRAQGVRTGVVTNQSGIGRGLLTHEQVAAVNARVDELFGRFGTWQICPHAPDEGCACRKPAPGLVLAACEALGVSPHRTLMVGDIGADVEAAEAAGAVSLLVPTEVTRADEVARAPRTADDLLAVLELVR
ncbi:haloacid dehalogenase [Lentzea guizhouensis]|uniref:D,D-heptose 1,7-bisphosphate phosphatase n=1 Tax=Lentzea guizhouensis TaxID=1586287 RepID=A0A1B2HQW5_9PSEU|nr:HAD family hydrolase [Lentzea guizhouensis]ANZ40120.1 haloacid dehalogenase [Lentzea guizhouensis]